MEKNKEFSQSGKMTKALNDEVTRLNEMNSKLI
jgi:hypothetical protein